ncbi:MAG TPA: tRNA uridine-5-carboxymethylaminomethyl(34) synthesis GTPase MnmE [Firmicutes bacterium]|nr:tRNA uridine-5-carboxymethylaminomethyl(34) synthesis GTPase MnmE [Bacillota bacterium]
MEKDTIAAIATAVGVGGIGIVRISGPKAFAIGDAIFSPRRSGKISEQESYSACYGMVIEKAGGKVIDEAIALVMRAPASYTREDVLELQCHGGPMAVTAVLKEVLAAGARLARPGEFTERAFLNGRLDLAQAEAVCDVIRATTEANLKIAQEQLQGRLSKKIRALREELLSLEARMEVAIDFPDDDLPELSPEQLQDRLNRLISELESLIAQGEQGRVWREGLATVIIGKPNVGKSSLLNALVGRQRALVTDIPGTTRDVIEEVINLSGLPLRLLDTAGIRKTKDVVEQLGVEAAKEQLALAQLVLLVLDAERGWEDEDELIFSLCQGKKTLILLNKIDVGKVLTVQDVKRFCPGEEVIPLSVKKGYGFKELEDKIIRFALGSQQAIEHVSVSNLRHLEALDRARKALQETSAALSAGFGYDIISTEVRSARLELGTITGETIDQELVDRIFQDFCIGK